jgi:hypothetical protein
MLEGVSIGGTLAEARQRARLTVADVSARTRIRQPIIRAIERGDFGACGGDFYARGHIRAIARTVGLDSEPLVREYDATSLPGRQEAAAGRPRDRGPWGLVAILLTALVVISLGSYRVAASKGGKQRLTSAAASGHPTVGPQSASAGTRPSPSPSPSSTPPSPSPRPSPATTPAHEVTPVSATAFGPGGTSGGDNPQNASLALSGNPSTPWNTDWYTTAQFGNLESGTGLLLDLGRTVMATGVTIHLGSRPGADLQVRAGTSVGGLSTVASASDAGGNVTLHLASPARARYLVIWFTSLPPDTDGTYQAAVSDVTVAAS